MLLGLMPYFEGVGHGANVLEIGKQTEKNSALASG